jgi:ectoine hydroxylase-related dioxygenase (phytanoyl-CoA dioxygenase family)
MGYERQRAQFRDEGYAVFEGALAGPLLELLRHQCGRFVAREDARMDALGTDQVGITHRGRRYFANECLREQPALRSMLFSETMAEICRATLGDTAYFFFDQYVVKGPEGGLPFSWHQDSGYMVANGGPPGHAPYLTCWCPLDDATADNGTVRVLPYSKVPASRDGVLPHRFQPGSNDFVGWEDDEGAVTVEAPAGSVVAFSSRTLHATGANQTPRMRRAYLAQYSSEVVLNPGTLHLRRNAIPLLLAGQHVTLS